MQDPYIIADNIYAPLGSTTAENFTRVCQGDSGLRLHHDPGRSPVPFYAAVFEKIQTEGELTAFEQLLKNSILAATGGLTGILESGDTLLILSSTKGNISLLENQPVDRALKGRIALSSSARQLQQVLKLAHTPLVISNACISGVLAIITARRLLAAGKYRHIIVSGADLITRFILSGFQSFHAVSDELCRPFDAQRKGINLGEAAATLVLSAEKPDTNDPLIRCAGGAVSGDANHISGPSRTGAELAQAMQATMQQAGHSAAAIDFISAHGTATVYNDDMESRAIGLNGLDAVPVNSLKGYYGHTLGAAGILETVISLESLRRNIIVPTRGFQQSGTVVPIHVCSTLLHRELRNCLKTASGFGGCNAAILLEKSE
ncbi:beta-ketoacyl synthase N-terminal-like domain-containing protein [Niabella terrae]